MYRLNNHRSLISLLFTTGDFFGLECCDQYVFYPYWLWRLFLRTRMWDIQDEIKLVRSFASSWVLNFINIWFIMIDGFDPYYFSIKNDSALRQQQNSPYMFYVIILSTFCVVVFVVACKCGIKIVFQVYVHFCCVCI